MQPEDSIESKSVDHAFGVVGVVECLGGDMVVGCGGG